MAWYKLDEEGNIEGLLKPLAPLINYVARLNGTDQHWQLSDGGITIPENTDFKISAIVNPTTNRNLQTLVGASSSSASFIRIDGLSGSPVVKFKLNNVELAIPAAGIEVDIAHKLTVTRVGSNVSVSVDDVQTGSLSNDAWSAEINFGILGALGTLVQYFDGAISMFELEIEGSLTHSIPLTNKAQGATQLATVGSVNAAMVNYDESVWEQA